MTEITKLISIVNGYWVVKQARFWNWLSLASMWNASRIQHRSLVGTTLKYAMVTVLSHLWLDTFVARKYPRLSTHLAISCGSNFSPTRQIIKLDFPLLCKMKIRFAGEWSISTILRLLRYFLKSNYCPWCVYVRSKVQQKRGNIAFTWMVKNVLLTSILFQMIMSPQFPSNYPPNINCHWVVSAPRREHVHLKFLDFNLESSAQCTKDSLSIKDLSSRDSVRNHPNASMIVSSDRVSSSRFHSVTFYFYFILLFFCLYFLFCPFSLPWGKMSSIVVKNYHIALIPKETLWRSGSSRMEKMDDVDSNYNTHCRVRR